MHVILKNRLLVHTFTTVGGELKYGLDIYDSKGETIMEGIAFPTTNILLKTDRDRRIYVENRDYVSLKQKCKNCAGILDIFEMIPAFVN